MSFRPVLVAMLISSLPLGALAEPASDTATLTLNVSGLQPMGTISLGLFDSQSGYEASKSVTGAQQTVTGETVVVVFDDLAPGEYGIKFYHDVNGNGKLDTNPFGMPVEPFGFSNNARGQFGPAGWDKAAFTVTAGENTHALAVN